ncbi:hypothetical protein K402DRAFT_389552 [Aulographum hederae CBS 113979]|uniref:WD40 repeat-like protein n=1 Tax=Aulographum hederae CBS 113979 TaxID=1176131 RepID=A0A6G1HC85_9PEZI|nr:hypothetical protein K402DRAFT_389552 [Aulographum hederae CBS 113979]
MMEHKNIPGFFFDKSKNRYFPITANHLATPSSKKYSHSSVSQAKAAGQKRKRYEEDARTIKQQTCLRSRLLTRRVSLVGREIGLQRRPQVLQDDHIELYVANLQVRHCMRMGGAAGLPDDSIGVDTDMEITAFDYSPENKLAIAISPPYHSRQNGSTLLEIEPYINAKHHDEPPVLWSHPDETPLFPGFYNTEDHVEYVDKHYARVSSVHIIPNCGYSTLLSFMGGGDDSPEIKVYDAPSGETGGPTNRFSALPTSSLTYQGTSVHIPWDVLNVWASAQNPSDSRLHAFGASDGVYFVKYEPPPDGQPDVGRWFTTHTDVMALCWMSTNILAAGLRDGSVYLLDQRHAGHSLRLHHGTCITGIAAADEAGTRLIVAGLNSKLCLYDLNVVDRDITKPEKKRKRRGASSRQMWRDSHRHHEPTPPPSKSAITFPTYTNPSTHPLPLAISLKSNLLAVAESTSSIALYSVVTGRLLRRWSYYELCCYDQAMAEISDPIQRAAAREKYKAELERRVLDGNAWRISCMKFVTVVEIEPANDEEADSLAAGLVGDGMPKEEKEVLFLSMGIYMMQISW